MRAGFPAAGRRGTLLPVRRLGLGLPFLLALVLALPAAAAERKGSGTDPAGDVKAGGTAAQDLVAFSGDVTDAGIVTAGASFAAPPVAGRILQLRVGKRTGDECLAPYGVFTVSTTRKADGTGTGAYNPEDATDANPKTLPVQVQFSSSGNLIALGTQDTPEHTQAFDCVEALSTPDGDVEYDRSDTPAALAADPPPAPPVTTTTAATTPPPPPPPPPPPTTASAPPVAVPQAAKLTVSLDGAPKTIRRNRTIALKLRIANDGSKPTGKITITRPAARGLSVATLAKSLGALKPAAKKTVTLRLRLTSKARTTTPVRLTVRSGKLKATSSVQLRIGTAKKAAPAAKDAPKNPLVGTYWWRTEVHVDRAWDNRALYFVDGSTVYSGFPKGGLPKTCTTPPAKPAEEFDMRDGCLPYTYDAKTGAITVGDKAGTFKDGKLTFDDDEFEPLALAAPGARFEFKDLEQTSFFGTCGVYSFCTVSYEYLTLTAAGEFVTARSSTTTSDTPSSYTQAGSYPPDQRGTYEVRAGGIIHLAYADGTVKDETFAIQTKDGQPQPVTEGVMVGDVNYYPDP